MTRSDGLASIILMHGTRHHQSDNSADMVRSTSNGTSLWLTIGGWTALVVLLGWVYRTMRKSAPKGHPDLVTEFRKTWHRDVARFPLHADLPRLSRKVFIHTRDGQTLVPPEEPIFALQQLVVSLAEQLYDSPTDRQRSKQISFALNSTFATESTPDADMQIVTRTLLLEHSDILGPELLGLLKTITQDIVAPGVIKMKRELSADMPYKDKRGEWFIHINFQHPEAVTVSHQKREQSFAHDQHQDFEFEWNLDLHFDTSISTLRSSSLHVTSLTFGPNASNETKERVNMLLSGYSP